MDNGNLNFAQHFVSHIEIQFEKLVTIMRNSLRLFRTPIDLFVLPIFTEILAILFENSFNSKHKLSARE